MASKRRQRRRKCERKKKYTKDQAFNVAVKMRSKMTGQRIDAYPCPVCGSWHVGHRPWKVQQQISSRRRMEDNG